MIPLEAAGGVVFRAGEGVSPEILMIYKRDVWDLPKGKMEANESREGCAVREVSEETGVAPPRSTSYLSQTYHEYEQGGKMYGKTTYWFAMDAGGNKTGENHLRPHGEEGIEQVRWFPLEEAIDAAGYDNLKNVLELFAERYRP